MKKQNQNRNGSFAPARLISLVPAPLAATFLAVAVAGGCQHHDDALYPGQEQVGAEIFAPETQVKSVDHTIDVQTASAARTDATLRPYHFDGAELNSLGQQKLTLISKDDRSALPLVVYLDLPQDASQGTRREAVMVYLKDLGLNDDQIRVEAGPNLSPDNLHMAAPSIRTMHLLDAGAPIGNNPEPVNGAAAAAAAAAPH